MDNDSIKILILSSNPAESKKLAGLFSQTKLYTFEIYRADSLKKAFILLKKKEFDAIFVDFVPADITIDNLTSTYPEIPIIALTDNQDSGILALEKGAEDYLYKDGLNLDMIMRSTRYLIGCLNAEKLVKNERQNLQTIMDTMDIGVIYIDENGFVKQANRTIKKWLNPQAFKNTDVKELKNFLNCVKCDEGTKIPGCVKIQNIIKKAINSNARVYDTEIEANILINLKPVRMWFEVNAAPMIINGKKNTILTMNDITERKNAEGIVERDKDAFEKLVKEKSRDLFITQIELDRAKRLSDLGLLSATVAHELRNPLAAIEMAAYNIRKKIPDPSITSHIKTIETKIDESEKIISNLLYYSRIKPPKLEKIKINEIIIECVNLVKKRFTKEGIDITYDLKPIREKLIDVDPLQIKEVLQNILNNAYEALKNREGKIDIQTRLIENFLEINIKDNGEGIEEEILQMLFSPFFTTKAKGTGLGLTVCKQIIQLHGGSIEILSKKNKGTTVIIKIPFHE